MLNIRTILIIIIICFYLIALCPRAKHGPVEVNGKGLRQTMDIQWLKLKLNFFFLSNSISKVYFQKCNFNYIAMNKKYKHELKTMKQTVNMNQAKKKATTVVWGRS